MLLWTSMTLLAVLAIYPLSLLGGLSSPWRALAMLQLLEAFIGSIGLIFYTGYLWYTCLHGLYRVDFEQRASVESTPSFPLFLSVSENMWVTFGTGSWLQVIADALCIDFFKRIVSPNCNEWGEFRPLPLKGLEWSFIAQDSDPEEGKQERVQSSESSANDS